MSRSDLRRAPLLLALLGLLAGAGCGRFATFDEFRAQTPQEYFLQQAAQALGMRVLRCEPKYGMLTSPAFEVLLHPAVGADVEAAYLNIIPSDTFDSAAADRCLAQLRAVDCSVRTGLNTGDCADLFAPTIPPGGACTSDANCIGGRCDPLPDACGGQCVALAAETEACVTDADCASPLWCNGGACAPLGVKDDPCNVDANCDALYWCDPSGSTCQPLPDVNQSCKRDVLGDDPCRESLVCTGALTPTCQVGHAQGQPCSFGVQPCAPGLRCSGTNQCVPLVAPGEACSSSENCPYGFACVSDTCQPYPSIGDGCDPTRPCIAGDCVGGTCQMLDAGATCNGFNLRIDSFGDQCVGYCDTTNPSNEVCADAIADGDPCTQDYQCLVGSDCVDPGTGPVCTPCGG